MKRSLIFSLLLAPLALAHEGGHPAPAGTVADGPVRTGNGIYTYDTVPGWGALPDGKNVGPTHGGIAVSADGTVFVSTDAKHGIVQIDKDGKFEKFLSPENKIHSLAIAKEGDQEFLYGAQLGKSRFVKMDMEGKIVLTIPNKDTGTVPGSYMKKAKDGTEYRVSPFQGITASAIAPNGDVYLAIGYGTNLVHRFDKGGKYLASFGGRSGGMKQDRFLTCHGLAIDTRFGEPRLLVVDREQGRLVHYTLDFKYIGTYTTGLRRPCAVDFHGDLCVAAELAGRTTVIDKNGTPVAFLGDNPNTKQRASFGVTPDAMKDGIFTAPHGVAFDNDGNIIVQDWNKTGRVTMLKQVK